MAKESTGFGSEHGHSAMSSWWCYWHAHLLCAGPIVPQLHKTFWRAQASPEWSWAGEWKANLIMLLHCHSHWWNVSFGGVPRETEKSPHAFISNSGNYLLQLPFGLQNSFHFHLYQLLLFEGCAAYSIPNQLAPVRFTGCLPHCFQWKLDCLRKLGQYGIFP